MPEYNLIQRPDLIQRIQSFFGIRQAHVTPTLSPTVQAVAIVADLTQENISALGVVGMPTSPAACAGRSSVGAVAAQFGRSMLLNPTGSNRLLRVKMISGPTATSSNFLDIGVVSAVSAPLGTIDPTYLLDLAQKNPVSLTLPTVGIVSHDTTAVANAQGFLKITSGIPSYPFPQFEEIVLDEGDACVAQVAVVNVATDVCWRWIEEPKATQ